MRSSNEKIKKNKIIRAGNSTAVTIPSDFVKRVGIRVGDIVKVETDLENGRVIYTFSGVRQLALKNSLFRKRNTSS